MEPSSPRLKKSPASGSAADSGFLLYPFGPAHLTGRYLAWLNDPETVRFSEQRHHVHTAESCRQYLLQQSTPPHQLWAIEETALGLGHVGNVSVTVDQANRAAELAILIGEKECRGRGLGRRVWAAALQACFRDLDLRLVTAGTMEVNQAMLRVFDATGMRQDGVLPGRFLWEGKEVALVAVSLRREEWFSRHGESGGTG